MSSGKTGFGGAVDSLVSFVAEKPKTDSLEPYLPAELVGGGIPFIAGAENEAVWHAASQACGTERVHYCYVVHQDRCWYLATPSSALATHPNSWCPLAAALPGLNPQWSQESTYVYEQEGLAGALRWDHDTGRMQLFLGASRTIMPRIQSLDANFIPLRKDVGRIVPWRNRALEQERLSRLTVRLLLLGAAAVTALSMCILVLAYMVANIINPRLDRARQVTVDAAEQLLIDASKALRSDVNQHLSRIIELYNTIGGFGGVLVRYEVKEEGKVEWEALIPSAVMPQQLNAIAVGAENGRVRIRGMH